MNRNVYICICSKYHGGNYYDRNISSIDEARGDARPDSDIDLLILVDKDDISTEDELNITDPLYKIELETGILINPFILPKKIWGKVVTPFYENVMKEGVALL